MNQETETEHEYFRSVNWYMNYQVSCHGRVMNMDTGEMLDQDMDANGNATVVLTKKGRNRRYEIPMLMADTFAQSSRPYLMAFQEILPEMWLPIEGYDNYLVSSGGVVMDMYTGEKLKRTRINWGNPCVILKKIGRKKNRRYEVHMLMARAFTRVIPNYVIHRGSAPGVSHFDLGRIRSVYSSSENQL